MTFVQEQIDLVQDQVYEWVKLVDEMMGEFIWAKEYIEHNDREFRHQMKRDNKKFIQKTKDELHAKGFRHQELIHKRHDAIEAELAR